MKTMLVVLIFSNSGLITGWWEPMATERACKIRQAQVEFQDSRKDTERTIMTAYCVEPFGMKGWTKR